MIKFLFLLLFSFNCYSQIFLNISKIPASNFNNCYKLVAGPNTWVTNWGITNYTLGVTPGFLNSTNNPTNLNLTLISTNIVPYNGYIYEVWWNTDNNTNKLYNLQWSTDLINWKDIPWTFVGDGTVKIWMEDGNLPFNKYFKLRK